MKLHILKRLLLSVIFVFALLANMKVSAAKSLHEQKNQKFGKVKKKRKAVSLITEDRDNYDAHKTVRVFAELLREKYGYDVTVLLGKGAWLIPLPKPGHFINNRFTDSFRQEDSFTSPTNQ